MECLLPGTLLLPPSNPYNLCPNSSQGVGPHTAPLCVAMNPESPNQRETEPGTGGFSDLLGRRFTD